ncbi:hypothetical protein G9A89_009202 [Geosiphon pyriformis]|nr:hypothetical protein G9A89_009202 [Geosiphon pyriformis]
MLDVLFILPMISLIKFILTLIVISTNAEYILPIIRPKFSTTPHIHDWTFNIAETSVSLDGEVKNISTVNGKYPGPTIAAFKNDWVRVRVKNLLSTDEKIAIHWHGILLKSTPWFDGVPDISQCGIPRNKELLYDFKALNPGTYWWHSTSKGSSFEGLVGPIIIHDPKDPHSREYDEEFIIMLSDWFHEISNSPESKNLYPTAGLINGKNGIDCAHSKCDSNSSFAKFKFEQGKRYRLRIINSSAQSFFKFSIDDHILDLIEIEGFPLISNHFRIIPLAPGQRVSVILKAIKPIRNYWMRANIDSSCYFRNPGKTKLNPNVNAIIHYDGAEEDVKPTTKSWTDDLEACVDLDLEKLSPLHWRPAPPRFDQQFNFDLKIEVDKLGKPLRGYFGKQSNEVDTEYPTISKVFDGYTMSDLKATSKDLYFYDKFWETIEVLISNPKSEFGASVIHLHGHNFWVIARNIGNYTANNVTLNTKTPIMRDTVVVPNGGYVVLRFRADNPGVWQFCSQIQWQLALGMSVQFVELPSRMKKLYFPQKIRDLCFEF